MFTVFSPLLLCSNFLWVETCHPGWRPAKRPIKTKKVHNSQGLVSPWILGRLNIHKTLFLSVMAAMERSLSDPPSSLQVEQSFNFRDSSPLLEWAFRMEQPLSRPCSCKEPPHAYALAFPQNSLIDHVGLEWHYWSMIGFLCVVSRCLFTCPQGECHATPICNCSLVSVLTESLVHHQHFHH